MIETVHFGIIAEESLIIKDLYKVLSQDITDIFFASTVAEALEETKNRNFDIMAISYDMNDYYSIDELITILLESVSIKKIIVFSEKSHKQIALEKRNDLYDGRIEMVFGDKVIHFAKTYLDEMNANHIKRDAQEQIPKTMMREKHSEMIPLVDSIPLGLYRIDPAGTFMDCNQTLITLFEAPHRDVLLEENYFSMFSDVDETENWLEIIRRDGIIRGLVFEVEQYNGNSIWVRDNAKSVLDHGCGDAVMDCLLNNNIKIGLYDINSEILNEADNNLKNYDYVRYNSKDEITSDFYDIAVSSNVLMTIDNDNEYIDVLETLKKV